MHTKLLGSGIFSRYRSKSSWVYKVVVFGVPNVLEKNHQIRDYHIDGKAYGIQDRMVTSTKYIWLPYVNTRVFVSISKHPPHKVPKCVPHIWFISTISYFWQKSCLYFQNYIKKNWVITQEYYEVILGKIQYPFFILPLNLLLMNTHINKCDQLHESE